MATNGLDTSAAGDGVSADEETYPLALMRSRIPSLSASEARVATVIVDRPIETMRWSASELGDAAGVSAATVVRTCRSLGFDGLPELRLAIARDVGWAPLVIEREEPSEPVAILGDMVRATRAALDDAALSVNAATFAAVVDAILAADHIVLASSGDTHPLAQDFAFRLSSMGRPTQFTPDTITQHVAARRLQPGDLCISVSNSGNNALSLGVALAAKAAGATLVGITATPGSRLGRHSDLVLRVGGSSGSIRVQTAVNSVAFLLLMRALLAAVGAKLGVSDQDVVRHTLDAMSGFTFRDPPPPAVPGPASPSPRRRQ